MSKFVAAYLFLVTLLLSSCSWSSDDWSVKSPDNKITVTLNFDKTNNLVYSISRKTDNGINSVIEPSILGIIREDAVFTSNLSFIEMEYQHNKKATYTLTSGKQLVISDKYNFLILKFKTEIGNRINIEVKIFNDGAALRYNFPEKTVKKFRILNELTSFNLPKSEIWGHAYDKPTNWGPAYETFFENLQSVDPALPNKSNEWAFPLLFKTNGEWTLITEAGLDGRYPASHINVIAINSFQIQFPSEKEAHGYYENTAYSELPWSTPWRVIITSKDLSTVVESNIVTSVSKPNTINSVDWIKPGGASWSWWSDNDSPTDYKRLLPFIDLAANMSWEYALIDANWNSMENGTIVELVNFATSRNVSLLLWYNSGGKHNTVSEEPREILNDKQKRRAEFKRIQKLGIKGIKVDFFNSDKQQIIKEYIDILEDAADFNLLVNFHGCTLPRGWRRTYPNLMSMEAIRGGECYIFDKEYPMRAPEHLTIAPFTRGVVGPTDYTPGGFSDNHYPHLTTYGFEMALPIILESGITHFTDKPSAYNELPSFVQTFLKNIPVVWEQTILLDGYPGEFVVMARKYKQKWYIAGINGQNTRVDKEINLSRLNINKDILLILDGSDDKNLIEKKVSTNNNKLSISFKPYGGFVGVVDIE